jgi:hypothetical protein
MKSKYEEVREKLMTQEHLHRLFEELEREGPSLDGQIKTVSEHEEERTRAKA